MPTTLVFASAPQTTHRRRDDPAHVHSRLSVIEHTLPVTSHLSALVTPYMGNEKHDFPIIFLLAPRPNKRVQHGTRSKLWPRRHSAHGAQSISHAPTRPNKNTISTSLCFLKCWALGDGPARQLPQTRANIKEAAQPRLQCPRSFCLHDKTQSRGGSHVTCGNVQLSLFCGVQMCTDH